MPEIDASLAWLALFGVSVVTGWLEFRWMAVTPWLAVNLVAFVAIAWLAQRAHKATYAIVARAMGLGVRSVREAGEIVLTAPRVEGLGARLAVVYLAGPVLHVAAIAVVAAALGANAFDAALAQPWHAAPAIVACFVVVNGALALHAVPFEVKRAGGRLMTTDALRAIRALAFRPDELLHFVALHHYDQCRTLIAAERGEEAAAIARELVDENRLPERFVPMKWMLGTALIAAGRYVEARAVLLESLGPPRPASVGTPLALNNAAWATLMTGDPALLDEADALSREALELAPDEPYALATRGTVLLRQGKTRAAVPLLEQSWRHTSSRRARAYRAVALAVAAAREGRAGEARARAADAKLAWPACDRLAWAEEEIALHCAGASATAASATAASATSSASATAASPHGPGEATGACA